MPISHLYGAVARLIAAFEIIATGSEVDVDMRTPRCVAVRVQ